MSDIHQLFDDAAELREAVLDLNVRFVRIAANGHWSYDKLGRTRHGVQPIALATVQQVAERVPSNRPLRAGEWALRKIEGVNGAALLIERLPIAIADRLQQTVLTTLKQQVKSDGNGALIGQPGSGKSGLLLWLALQIPDQPVLYIAENPPNEFPGTHVMHVFPPGNPDERRALERFARLAPVVMWERLTRPDDLSTLFGFAGASRRWFTSDASEIDGALNLLNAAHRGGFDVALHTILYLASSVIGRPEARNLLIRDDATWREVWTSGTSLLHLLNGEPPPAPLAPAPAAQLTIEVSDLDVEAQPRSDDAVTGMIPGDAIEELRERGMLGDEPPPSEATRAYVETPRELLHDLTKPSRYFDEAPDAVVDAEVKLEDLRITTMDELNPEDLSQLQEELGDLDSDFSEVLREEIDFDLIASEMLSEISDIEPLLDEAAMATDPNQVVLGVRIDQRDDGDSTRQFTVGRLSGQRDKPE